MYGRNSLILRLKANLRLIWFIFTTELPITSQLSVPRGENPKAAAAYRTVHSFWWEHGAATRGDGPTRILLCRQILQTHQSAVFSALHSRTQPCLHLHDLHFEASYWLDLGCARRQIALSREKKKRRVCVSSTHWEEAPEWGSEGAPRPSERACGRVQLQLRTKSVLAPTNQQRGLLPMCPVLFGLRLILGKSPCFMPCDAERETAACPVCHSVLLRNSPDGKIPRNSHTNQWELNCDVGCCRLFVISLGWLTFVLDEGRKQHHLLAISPGRPFGAGDGAVTGEERRLTASYRVQTRVGAEKPKVESSTCMCTSSLRTMSCF
ncbi:hypothetical protein B0T10DRAFT_48875 [Thelonectria olida]|uniref:Uncharacterized protein n=1 Tax=Thelonectria olida TaxID=1576542 RepID=A0A9P8W484_9HYPO|nr:hypothetical protein B0T10DRAFT_48875 [Thelonectria olida]